MKYGIIGALDAEVALLIENMVVNREVKLCGSTYCDGMLCGVPATVVCASVGTINAAVCADIIIREFGAQAVVNVGIAGAVDRRLHILDVVVSTDVIFHDMDPTMDEYYPYAHCFKADERLIALCVRACEVYKERDFACYTGRIATGDRFVDDSAVKADIVARTAPFCVEMEGAAIGQVAYMHSVPFIVIRTMSDNADEAADKTYDDFMDRAARHSADILMNMLRLSKEES